MYAGFMLDVVVFVASILALARYAEVEHWKKQNMLALEWNAMNKEHLRSGEVFPTTILNTFCFLRIN
jgi:hypothetical protein